MKTEQRFFLTKSHISAHELMFAFQHSSVDALSIYRAHTFTEI